MNHWRHSQSLRTATLQCPFTADTADTEDSGRKWNTQHSNASVNEDAEEEEEGGREEGDIEGGGFLPSSGFSAEDSIAWSSDGGYEPLAPAKEGWRREGVVVREWQGTDSNQERRKGVAGLRSS